MFFAALACARQGGKVERSLALTTCPLVVFQLGDVYFACFRDALLQSSSVKVSVSFSTHRLVDGGPLLFFVGQHRLTVAPQVR